MRLARLSFDDTVTIFLGKDTGGGEARQDVRDSSFAAADGWELEWFPDGDAIRIWREGMPEATYLAGYGFSCTLAADEAPTFIGNPFGTVKADAVVTKGKRR